MNFDKAIECHVQWKSKLSAYLAKPDHSVSAANVALDGNCELGKWLQGEGRKYSALPEFAKLTADHAHFHVAAANVIRKADAGLRVSEEIALGAKSEYASASNAVVISLMKMKKAA